MEIVKFLWELVLGGLAVIILLSFVKSLIDEITKPIKKKRALKELKQATDDFCKGIEELSKKIKEENNKTKNPRKTKTKSKKEDE